MKVLFIKWKCFGIEDIVASMERIGIEVQYFDFPYGQKETRNNQEVSKELVYELAGGKYDFVFSYNFFPAVSLACNACRVKYAAWVYDSPFIQLYSNTVRFPYNYVFIFERAAYQDLKNRGVDTVYYLPMAAPVERYDTYIPNEKAHRIYDAEISFVGSTYQEEKNQLYRYLDQVNEYTRGYLEGMIEAQKRVYGCFFLEKMLTPDIVKELQRVCPIVVNADGFERIEWVYANYFLARKVTALERKEILQLLSKRWDLKLYTNEKTPELPLVKNCGNAEMSKEAPVVYKCSKINLNITLRSIHSGIPLRAMDIMGCGGFLLTNYQEDMLEHFVPDEDFVYYSDYCDLEQKVGWYLTHEKERKEIAENGRQKMRQFHTYDNRLQTVLETLYPAMYSGMGNEAERGNIISLDEAAAEQECFGKKVLIWEGVNAILDYTSGAIQEALKELGYTVYVGNVSRIQQQAERLKTVLGRGIEFGIVLNNIGWLFTIDGINLWDAFQVPCYNYILDHPLYYMDTMEQAPQYGIVVCVDRKHVEFLQKFAPCVKRSIFLPLAGERETYEEKKKWKEREIEVLFAGQLKRREEFRFNDFQEQIIEELLVHPHRTTEEVMEECYRREHPDAETEEIKDVIVQNAIVDIYMKYWYRHEAVRRLVEAGIRVSVYGNGWEKADYADNVNLQICGAVEQKECIHLMGNSKIVLNVMPWFKDGIHDRVINAMLAGAVCVTDESGYLSEIFEAQEDYVPFRLEELDELPKLVERVLTNESIASSMIQSAYQKAAERDTWSARMRMWIYSECSRN